MGHRCFYEDRILWDADQKQFYRSVTAFGQDKKKNDRSLEVIRIYEDGNAYGRNLCFTYLGGYCVNFPGERIRPTQYQNAFEVEEEDFEKLSWECNLWISRSVIDKEYILRYDESLKFLLQKYSGHSNDMLLKLIVAYREHPEIELLVEIGEYKLATDKRLHKLSPKKKQEVIRFVKNNSDNVYMDLTKIFTCLKNNIEYKFYDTWKACKDNKELFHYLLKQKQTYDFYKDYKKMAIKAGHDFEEDYWKYPRSLLKAHDKVLKECENIDAAVNFVLNKQFEIIASKLKKQERVIDGNHYYIVQNPDDFANQANQLKQCLICAGYMKKIIQQESILIFIKDKELQPIGTVEINYAKKIIQAYGNESNRSDCLLPAEIMDAAKKYIDGIKVRKHKFSYSLPKNCYFKGLYDQDTSFNGLKFQEGQIYQTNFADDDIIKIGSDCMATDKVFHFCKSIQEIKSWVNNPASYAIVEALGAVVHNGTAYGSNRIKIRKIMSVEDVAKTLLSLNKAVSEIIA